MINPFSLEGKNIIISGASSGIGRSCAILCSEMGANVILLSRDQKRMEETRERMVKRNHLIYELDVTDSEKIEPVISNAVSILGRMDGFIHSAGVELTLPMRMTKPAHFEKLFKVNVVAGFELVRIITSKKYFNENTGSLVFIASVTGMVGELAKTAYCSSKGAVISGTRALAIELAPKKIRVNAVSPALVETKMTENIFNTASPESKIEMIKAHPLGIGMPEDVAFACIYLLSDASRWVTGTNLVVDGGYTSK